MQKLAFKLFGLAITSLAVVPCQAQIANGTTTTQQLPAAAVSAQTPLPSSAPVPVVASEPAPPTTSPGQAAMPAVSQAPTPGNPEAERVLFSDANSFGTNQAQDLRTRSPAEQIEILTRYVAIQSEQIRALEAKIRMLAENNPSPANPPLPPALAANALPNFPPITNVSSGALHDSQRAPAAAIMPPAAPPSAPPIGTAAIPVQNGMPTPKP